DGHARAGSACRNRLPAKGFRRNRHRHRSAMHGGRPGIVQSPPGRADRAAGLTGLDGVTAMAAPDTGSDRESELTHALASVRSRLAAAAEAAGRNVGDIEVLPITKYFPATD